MKPYLNYEVFQELKNPDYFKQVSVAFGTVTWRLWTSLCFDFLFLSLRHELHHLLSRPNRSRSSLYRPGLDIELQIEDYKPHPKPLAAKEVARACEC